MRAVVVVYGTRRADYRRSKAAYLGHFAQAGGVEVRFIKASGSDALGEETLARLRMVADGHRVHLHTVRGGHWIHADNPDAVVQVLAHHLP